jgi:putative flippase GtrA
MSNPIILGGIFLAYALFCIFTFETYSKRQELTKISFLIAIYIYYSILAAYVLNLVLIELSLFEKIVQISMNFLICGLILTYYYNAKIKGNSGEKNYNDLYV